VTETNPILDAIAQIVAAVKLVPRDVLGTEVLAYTEVGEEAEPPAVVIGPPALDFQAQTRSATSADVEVFVVVDVSEGSLDQLYRLAPAVAAAIDEHVENGVVTGARPGLYPLGTRELPAYSISVSIDL